MVTIELKNIELNTELVNNNEFREILYYEFWEPGSPESVCRFRFNKDTKTWEVLPPYEQFDDQELRFYPYDNGKDMTNKEKCCCLKIPQATPLFIPLTNFCRRMHNNEPVSTPHPIFLLRVYTSECGNINRFSDPENYMRYKFPQSLCEVAFLGDHLMRLDQKKESEVTVSGIANHEVKFLHKVNKYIDFKFKASVKHRLSYTRPIKTITEYWDQRLKIIWDEFLEKELNFCPTQLCEMVVPLSVLPDCIPVPCGKQYDATFDNWKGLPVQSLFLLDGVRFVDESYLDQAFTQCLEIRGNSVHEFFTFCNTQLFSENAEFIDKKLPKDTFKLFHEYLADIIRVCTMLSTTHPYVSDYRYDKDFKAVPSDRADRTIRTIMGDCEDGAIASLFIYATLLQFKDWKSPVVQFMRKIAAIGGVPVTISGKGKDPNVAADGDPLDHYYSVVIPFKKLHYALTGNTLSRHDDPLVQYVCLKYGLKPFMLDWINDTAVMETTTMTTAFYHDRKEEGNKDNLRRAIETQLCYYGDKKLSWKNYTTMHPLSATKCDIRGEIAHCTAMRVFIPAIKFFYDESLLENKLIKHCDLRIQHSLVVQRHDKVYGVDTFEFFESTMTPSWKLVPTAKMTDTVFTIQLEIVKSFFRPDVPIKATEWDPCAFYSIAETIPIWNEIQRTEAITKPSAVIPKDKSKRFFIYAWRLIPSDQEEQHLVQRNHQRKIGTIELMNKIAKSIHAQSWKCVKFGNGFAFVFNIEHA